MIAQLDRHYLQDARARVWGRLVAYVLFEGRPATTRGRWINPLLFMLYALIRRVPPFKKVERPIYIVGTGRSGTTVLGKILSTHPDVVWLNEPKALWHAVFPDEDVIGSYSLDAARYRLGLEDVDQGGVDGLTRLYAACLLLAGGKRVVDKYPELIFRYAFVKGIFPDARFIFLVRNAFDVCASIQSWSERHETRLAASTENWWGVNDRKWRLMVEQLLPEHPDLAEHIEAIREFRSDADRAAVEWLLTMREGKRLLSEHAEDVMPVYYEHLCERPEETLEEIARFCGLIPDRRFLSYGAAELKPVRSHGHRRFPSEIEDKITAMMKDLGYEI